MKKMIELHPRGDIVGLISNKIVEYLDHKGVFEQMEGDVEKNKNRNHYILCMLISNIAIFLPIMLLSILISPEWFIKGFLFTLYYRLLRWQLGGFHFESPNLCLYISTLLIVLLTYLSLIIRIEVMIGYIVFLTIVLLTLTIGPQLSRDKINFEDNEESSAKRVALIIITIFLAIYYFTNSIEIILAMVLISIMVLGAYIKKVIFSDVK